ncbi:MAG: hypothetical protein VX100_18195 [Pseudomonadota bacterium]|nr:hypothetical protein [Pseudomonadota bacterium]
MYFRVLLYVFSTLLLLGCVGEGETSKSVSEDAAQTPVPVGSEGGVIRFDGTGTLDLEVGAVADGLTLSVDVAQSQAFPDAQN